jgi:transcriptional regulator with XRE-family HTH domain
MTYTSWNINAGGKKVRQCRADRMEHAKRLRALLADLGLKHPDAAKLLHVSLRTLQNWLSGRHEVPYAAYKLLRLLRYMELPGAAWVGWHFSRGQLVTPEGRTISGKDGAWWSLLVRQAQGFGELYRQRVPLLAELSALRAAGSGAAAGLVSVSTTVPLGQSSKSSQSDVIMTSWPTLYDSLPPSMPTPAPVASAWASASTPCSASPLTPTCGAPVQPLTVPSVPALPGQSLPTVTPTWPSRPHPRPRLPLPDLARKSSARPNAGKSPGSNGWPAKADRAGGAV